MAEVTDFLTDTTQEYQELKRVMIQAINNIAGNAAKKTWLTAMLTAAELAADTGATILPHEWEQDDSTDAFLKLKTIMSRTLSENVAKGATAHAKLEALINEALALIP